MALIGPMRYLTIGDKTYEIEASGGSVTSVGVDNATGESDFTISGSPITSSGTITIEHANSTTAKSTQAVYPITFDKHGHITGSGSAVTIPTASDTYSSTSSNVMTGKGVNAALQTLDSSISATTGQAISAITITDGKIASSTKIAVGDANQNAFSNVKVGNTTIAADTTTDTLELAAGTDITLTPDATNDKVTVAFSNASGYTKNTGTVTQVTAGTGLTTTSGSSTDGGNITTSGTLHLTKSGVTAGTYQGITVDAYGRVTSASDQGYTSNTGTVTSVGISNATNGGLSVSGSPVTGSGSITVGHSNVLTSAQTTQAVYPIKIDKNGHISAYGSAVTNVSSFTNDVGYLTLSTLPIYDGTVLDHAEGEDF